MTGTERGTTHLTPALSPKRRGSEVPPQHSSPAESEHLTTSPQPSPPAEREEIKIWLGEEQAVVVLLGNRIKKVANWVKDASVFSRTSLFQNRMTLNPWDSRKLVRWSSLF